MDSEKAPETDSEKDPESDSGLDLEKDSGLGSCARSEPLPSLPRTS